ncbi:MAG: hypothetical protein ACLQIQ_12800 [Beijerinckiaceae bacterium]
MSDTEEFRLKIEAFTPETMPMQRLADYLAQFALMLGESASVHFVRLEEGSTSVVHRIQREAVPKVKARTASIRRGLGPRDSVRAYRRINRMLRDDNGSAVWREEKTEAEIIVFPGIGDAEEVITGISQHGSIDGEVVRVGGLQTTVPIMLKCEHDELSGCWASKAVAKALGGHLFEPVRLFGTGRWNRNDEGKWTLDNFRVGSFVTLRDAPLSAALNEIRALQIEWDGRAYEELTMIRDDEEIMHGGL